MLQLVVANGTNITKVSTHLFLPSDATATAIYPAIVCFRLVLHVEEKRKIINKINTYSINRIKNDTNGTLTSSSI